MNEGVNPYAAPEAHVGGSPYGGGRPDVEGAVPGDVVTPLLETRRWVMVIGVLCMIFAAFMVLAALGMLAMAGMTQSSELPFPPAALALFYLAFAGSYVPPSIFLLRYASSIRQLEHHRAPSTLVDALTHQKSFWKYAGIVSLVIVALYLLIFVGAAIAGFMSAMP